MQGDRGEPVGAGLILSLSKEKPAHRGAATACPLGRERELDVLLLRTFGRRMHIGVVVGGRRMLHIQKGIDACHEAYDGLEWRGRIEAVYRPAALEERIDRR